MEEDDIEEVVKASETIADTEMIGGGRQAHIPIPIQADPADGRKISTADLAVLKGRFPHLADFSDSSHVENHRRAPQDRIDQHEAA